MCPGIANRQAEWPGLLAAIRPEGNALDTDAGDLQLAEFEDIAETFTAQVRQRLAQLTALIAHDMRPELPVRAVLIAVPAGPFGHI